MTDKRLIGKQNQESILIYLNRFGWLTIGMLAKLVWSSASQASALARRTMQRMLDDKLVVKRALTPNMYCYTLSAQGSKYLKEKIGIPAESGAKLKLANSYHRACGNWFLIDKILNGISVWTEYEIQTGRAPFKNFMGKVPDAIVQGNEGLIWVEVENSWKNTLERKKIMQFCAVFLPTTEQRMTELSAGQYLERVAIVGTTRESLRSIFNTFRDAYKEHAIKESELYSIDMHYIPVNEDFNASPPISGNLWYDAISPIFFN